MSNPFRPINLTSCGTNPDFMLFAETKKQNMAQSGFLGSFHSGTACRPLQKLNAFVLLGI
jgi:hypothetical protein